MWEGRERAAGDAADRAGAALEKFAAEHPAELAAELERESAGLGARLEGRWRELMEASAAWDRAERRWRTLAELVGDRERPPANPIGALLLARQRVGAQVGPWVDPIPASFGER